MSYHFKNQLSRDQQEAMLRNTTYFRKRWDGSREYGRVKCCLTHPVKHKFGAVVRFDSDGDKGNGTFYTVNPQTMRVEQDGEAPPRPAKKPVPVTMQPTLFFFEKGATIRYGDGKPPRKV